MYLSRKPRYRESIPARFWLKNNPSLPKNRYWFHGCSLGEINALLPLIKIGEREGGREQVVVTTTTNTGFQRAQNRVGNRARYLPIELFIPFWASPPTRLIVAEAEFWLFLFYWVNRHGGKVIIVNGRIPDRSYPKYRRFRWFYRSVFKQVEVVLAQSEQDRKRFLELGAREVEVVGNIKSYTDYYPTKFYQFQKPVVVVASTHRGEELPILEQIDYNLFQVVVAPRHPERFEEVGELIAKFTARSRLGWRRLGKEGKQPFANIYLVDRLGELINLYQIADRVILGGSFIPNIGGHNPMEVAHFQKPLIIGPFMEHQRELLKLIKGWQMGELTQLKEIVNRPNLPFTQIVQRVDLTHIWNRIKG